MKDFNISFIRLNFIKPIIDGLKAEYGISSQDLGIPDKLLEEPLSLVPQTMCNHWLELAERLSEDPLFMLKLSPYLRFENIQHFNNWVYYTPDLAITFRRINYGTSCLQSGCTFHGLQSGHIIKWCYLNPFVHKQGRLHDSVRVALMMVNMLRHYLGDKFVPLQVNLTGPTRDKPRLEAFFGCKVNVGTAQTEVWLNNSVIAPNNESQWQKQAPLRLNDAQLDELVNIPQPHDMAKSLYSLINFSRYYGRPSVAFLADCLDMSRQQLQRRLLAHGWNFSSMTSYVLCNEAIQYLFKGYQIEDISERLAYSNQQSFCRAFKRLRGITPHQYLQSLNNPPVN
ncbi:AraC family transcriptional regulator [Agarivorans sp. TSD2052]|uniref:helix-turn-helix domain-containing protein n=1 Tax=Agarivorans sp. TSD2052 TaxID=2937286 RepID=UPI00200D9FC2|nr:AraC family transcriptional regulator [Agarivorans sp. TSD2052]UPW17653.1 AraC family transcriptional regulator [Agarivorans sp. TSD2052]